MSVIYGEQQCAYWTLTVYHTNRPFNQPSYGIWIDSNTIKNNSYCILFIRVSVILRVIRGGSKRAGKVLIGREEHWEQSWADEGNNPEKPPKHIKHK